jgi:hypothetical protein
MTKKPIFWAEASMDDVKHPPAKPDGDRPADIAEVERMLDEGIDDLDAGRTVSREESRRRIETLLASSRHKSTIPPR